MNKFLIKISCPFLLLGILLFVASCGKEVDIDESKEVESTEVATKWADMTLRILYKLPSNTPTYGSRALGYMGLTMYESVVQGSKTHRSLRGQLLKFDSLPVKEEGKTYNWELALNAGQHFMIRKMLAFASDSLLRFADSLANALEKSIVAKEDAAIAARSIDFGKSVGTAIFNWSKNDGGHEGYLRNFPTEFVMPTTPGSWTPPKKSQSKSQRPLHPYWGSNRTFALANSALPVPVLIPYSTNRFSQCYAQFLEIYAKNGILTEEERQIGAWWSDDPTETMSPPGHSYNLATIAIRKAKPNLTKAAESYARVGMAVTDAFINCFRAKYTYFSERPSTYIRDHIDGNWLPYWPEPPFPAFTSGHATQGAAAAIVLTSLYGDPFPFTDNTHQTRERDTAQKVDFRNRSFITFWEAAEESAFSRFLGGIHTKHDNTEGLIQGRKVGQNINALLWRQ